MTSLPETVVIVYPLQLCATLTVHSQLQLLCLLSNLSVCVCINLCIFLFFKYMNNTTTFLLSSLFQLVIFWSLPFSGAPGFVWV